MKKLLICCELRYAVTGPSTLIFNIEAARHPSQQIVREALVVDPIDSLHIRGDDADGNRLLRINVTGGEVALRYDAIVTVEYRRPLGNEREIPIAELPLSVVPYLWPSRYCESDSLSAMAIRTFGSIAPGYHRVEAICQWIRDNIVYQIGTTGPTTTARDVLADRAGVCRDYAHLAISFCRALNIPARMVTGYTWYPDPPPDFHAIFEVYLEHRWILFDATQLAPLSDVVRLATGKDASETAFATLFGPVKMLSYRPDVTLLPSITTSPANIGVPRSTEPIYSNVFSGHQGNNGSQRDSHMTRMAADA
jgi:transglutaminase-like putative cysteine protease